VEIEIQFRLWVLETAAIFCQMSADCDLLRVYKKKCHRRRVHNIACHFCLAIFVMQTAVYAANYGFCSSGTAFKYGGKLLL
jgi:hypothetical protein